MSKMEKSIVAYKDDKSLYASDSKALKIKLRDERRKERAAKRLVRRHQRRIRRDDRRYDRYLWKQTKKKLYNQAHSQDRYDEADMYVSGHGFYTQGRVKRYEKKLKNKEYRRLKRNARRWR